MDRASFLRSLDFLRPLPPDTWDDIVTSVDGNNNVNDDDDDGAYSGSTMAPPTPASSSSRNSTLIIDGSNFVVSIEPNAASSYSGLRIDRGNGRPGNDTDDDNATSVRPAFFGHRVIDNGMDDAARRYDVADDVAVSNSRNADVVVVVTVTSENPRRDGMDGIGEFERNDRINSDPSLCTFEMAMITALGGMSSVMAMEENARGRGGGGDAASSTTTPEDDTREEGESTKMLLFRFGHRFTFRVDESAILDVRYEPGGIGDKYDDDDDDDDRHRDEETRDDRNITNGSPPTKRHRNERDGHTSRSGKVRLGTARARDLPPSLIISFGSCNFRIFSFMECGIVEIAADAATTATADAETTRPSSRIWSTLSNTTIARTVEDRLVNARSVLLRHFVDDGEGGKRRRGRDDASASITWRMAPPGSGQAFRVWPSNNSPSCGGPFVDEGWSCCLGGGNRGMIKCASSASSSSSPQKCSSSPTTSGSGSTNLEHGQKELRAHSMNWSENDNIDKRPNDENVDVSCQTSGSTQESKKQYDEKCGVDLSENRSSLPGAHKNDDNESETSTKEPNIENGGSKYRCDTSLPIECGTKEQGSENGTMKDDGANTRSWKDVIRTRYHLFHSSAVQMEQAISAAESSRHSGNVSVVPHLNSCAESLTRSYLSIEEFNELSQRFEDEIGDATSEMEREIERMFPARGRKSTIAVPPPIGRNAELQRKFEELLSSRREAVRAKLTCLMIPKR